MIANFFNKTKPKNIVLLLVLLTVFLGFALYQLHLLNFSLNFWLLKSADLVLVFILFFVFSFIIDKNRLTYSNHYGLLFISLLFGLFYPILLHTQFLLIQVFLALAFRRIYSIRINQRIKEKLFDSAFLIGIASLFFQESIVFILLIYIAILVFQRTYWNYIFIPLIGLMIPYFLIYVYGIAFQDNWIINQIFNFKITFNLALFQQFPLAIYVGIIFVIGVTSFIICTTKINNINNEFRGLWRLIFVHFILASILLFFGNHSNLYNAVYLIFPTGVIMANYLQTIKAKWQKDVLVYLFIALLISGFFYNFKP